MPSAPEFKKSLSVLEELQFSLFEPQPGPGCRERLHTSCHENASILDIGSVNGQSAVQLWRSHFARTQYP